MFEDLYNINIPNGELKIPGGREVQIKMYITENTKVRYFSDEEENGGKFKWTEFYMIQKHWLGADMYILCIKLR